MQMYFVFVVVAIAATLHFFETRGGHRWRLLWLPVADWILMLAAVIPVYHLACLVSDTLVSILEAIAACMELDNVHYVIYGITPALRHASPSPPCLS